MIVQLVLSSMSWESVSHYFASLFLHRRSFYRNQAREAQDNLKIINLQGTQD